MNIIIVDDERDARLSVRFYIEKYLPAFTIIGEADSVSSGKKLLTAHNSDVLFLDISLSDGTGFDLLNAFPDRSFHVVFVTGHDDYAIKAFRYSALDYILKPIDSDDFIQVAEKLMSLSGPEELTKKLNLFENQLRTSDFSKIAIPNVNGTVFLEVNEIVHLESDGNYTTITTEQKKSIVAIKLLKEYEELLPKKSFFRIHKSHIVNLKFIDFYNKADEVIRLLIGRDVPVARRRKKGLLIRMKL